MQFVSYCHRFCVRLLKTFWTQSFTASCICLLTAVQCSRVVPYNWAGWSYSNSSVSAADCPNRNWAQDTTSLSGKRKWRNWTLSWTLNVNDELLCHRSVSTQQDSVFLGCDRVIGCRVPVLCSSIVYSSSRSDRVSMTAWIWSSRHYVLKYWFVHSQSHSITSWQTRIFNDTTVRTS